MIRGITLDGPFAGDLTKLLHVRLPQGHILAAIDGSPGEAGASVAPPPPPCVGKNCSDTFIGHDPNIVFLLIALVAGFLAGLAVGRWLLPASRPQKL